LDSEWLAGLDATGVCAAVEARHTAVVRGQAELFFLAAHWADLHSGEALLEQRRRSGLRVLPGMERAKRIGAHGTPTVAEFAAAELGALQGMGHVAADHLIRDALNVRHRHPLLWAAIAAGEGRVWQARKVAQLCACAGLDRDQAGWVDAQTTPYLGCLPWGRFESLVEAKIIEADPAAAEERRLAASLRRFVRSGQSNEYGLKTLVARANAGDVIFFVAMVDRIAQVLAVHGDTDPVDVRRSKAIGILATPERALRLLQSVTPTDPDPTDPTDDGGEAEDRDGAIDGVEGDGSGAAGTSADGDAADELGDPEVVGELDVHPSQNDADDAPPEPRPCPACEGTGGVVGDPTPFLKPGRVDPRQLLPDATLYVHLSQAALRRGTGAAGAEPIAGGSGFVEGVGPVTVQQVAEFLRHTNVRVVPVLDLADQGAVDAYRVPARMAEALHLRNPACVSPWGTNTSRRKDKDHVIPYLPLERGGRPGQTHLGNLAWLARFPHRLKTHGRWRLRQTGPGSYEWRSPHGYRFRVDRGGTHYLGKEPLDSPRPQVLGEQSARDQVPDRPASDKPTTPRCSRDRPASRRRRRTDSRPGGPRVIVMEIYKTDLALDLTNWRHG